MIGLPLRDRVLVRATGPLDLPLEFTWRGKRHRVYRIDPVRSAVRHGRYSLTTTDGMRCVVYQDQHNRTWHIERILPRRDGGHGG